MITQIVVDNLAQGINAGYFDTSFTYGESEAGPYTIATIDLDKRDWGSSYKSFVIKYNDEGRIESLAGVSTLNFDKLQEAITSSLERITLSYIKLSTMNVEDKGRIE